MAKSRAEQRLAALQNKHKWYVGGGRRILWAPEFPVFLERPGYWDFGTYLEIKLESLFTYAVLEQGAELHLRQTQRTWRPDRLVSTYAAPGLHATETKTLTLDDAFRSDLELRNTTGKARTLDVVLWGRVNASDTGSPTFGPAHGSTRGIQGEYTLRDDAKAKVHELLLDWTFGNVGGRATACTSWAVQNSETGGELPDWRLSPFYELFNGTRLPNTCYWWGGIENRPGHPPHRKHVFVALHRRVRLGARQTVTLRGACQATARQLKPQAKPVIPGWDAFFEQAPAFTCDDAYFQKYYDYRWYGLRLNTIDCARRPLNHPAVCEGVNAGWFRHAISYSAQILPRDCRWLHDKALAQGCILNFMETQGDDGFIFGGLMTEKKELEWHAGLMYHSDWGGVVRSVHEVHPDRAFLKQCYAALTKYAEYFDRERDADRTGLYDIRNQAETGQEYMSRYLFVDPKADEWGPLRLKGVDATVYIYKLQRELAWMAGELGLPAAEAANWNARADATAQAVRTKMWDPRRKKFCDIDPKTGKRSPVKALTDFYPFLTDIAQREHVVALREHLLNPKRFWTPWPAPATALDDPTADIYGRWLNKRHMCPWNGRSWLMTNSHIADVLAQAARTLDRRLERYAAEFLRRFIRMMFVDRDVNQPTSYEYYNPLTGQAPFFRGVDDYMHSYVIDLIIRHVVGLQPLADGLVIVAPLDFGLKRFAFDNAIVAGKPVSVKWNGKTLSASVGRQRLQVQGLGKLVF